MESRRSRDLLGGLMLVALCGAVAGCACWRCPSKPPAPGPAPPEPPVARLSTIEVEDAIEAALLEQELGLVPVTIREGRFVYYEPDEELDLKLANLGYTPVDVDAARVLQRVMKILRKPRADEAPLHEAGVTLILRQKCCWVVRGTYRQLKTLARLGYPLADPEEGDLRPRQVRVSVASFAQIGEVARAGVDIYSAGPLDDVGPYELTHRQVDYVVYGGAFDDAIDRLRELDFDVEVLPSPEEPPVNQENQP